jgi:hypothetical protein
MNDAKLKKIMDTARPDIVFRILVGPDPEYPEHRKAAMVIKNGELWFSLAGDKRDWNRKKTAAAVRECCLKIIEDYCKKEFDAK